MPETDQDYLGLSTSDWAELWKDASIFRTENREVILHIYGCPGHRATPTMIAQSFGVEVNRLNSQNQALGQRILKFFGKLPRKNPDRTNKYWDIVNESKTEWDAHHHYFWTLRPNLCAAIAAMYDAYSQPMNTPKREQKQAYTEGSAREVRLTVYERNPKARQDSIDHYGARCQACGCRL